MGGGKSCTVVGCLSRTVTDKTKHFYKFPKNPVLRDVWHTFTRRGSDYEVKHSSCICQDHFDPSCFVYKKKQQRIAKKSVPTIFHRPTPEGNEKIVLTFDSDVQHYVEEETLLNPAFDKDKREKELVEKRQQKLKQIGSLCRFCFEEDQDEDQLVSISKLKDYAISPNDMLNLIGVNTQYNDIFSKQACEDCFQQIITLDGYRKRCQKAQNSLINDIKALDQSIQKLRKSQDEPNSWFKPEASWGNQDDDIDDDDYQNDSASLNAPSPVKTEKVEQNFQQIIIKEEREDSASDDEFADFQIPSVDMEEMEADDSDSEMPDVLPKEEVIESKSEKKKRKRKPKAKAAVKADPVEEATDDVKPPKPVQQDPADTRPHNQRTYECFFCHLNYNGLTAYKLHDCQVKELFCEVEGCGKVFMALSGFKQHIEKLHKLPKISRMYCTICRFSQVINEEDFKEHVRGCERKIDRKISDNSITCDKCGKFCPTQKSYSIHLMFHKITEPYHKQSRHALSKKRNRGVFMCESCGKEFATARYLLEHTKRLHAQPVKNPTIFTCDHCGKTRTSRYAMNKHIKNVHTISPTPCKVCGKVFRNKTLVQAHMLYHKDSKRIHFCPLCPEKPPYWTAVALKRHQESNHGFGTGHQCETCMATYRTKPGLLQHKAAAHGYRTPISQPKYQGVPAYQNIEPAGSSGYY